MAVCVMLESLKAFSWTDTLGNISLQQYYQNAETFSMSMRDIAFVYPRS